MAILRNLFFLLLGLIALPLLLVLNFRTMWAFGKSLFSGLTDVSLAEKEYRDRITIETVKATLSMERRAAVEAECRAYADAGDWRGLGQRLMAWDQARARCDAGFPLARIGADAVLHHLASQVVEGHACHPDPIAILPDEAVDLVETRAAMHPECYPLLALAAEMRCHQGWVSRGPDFADYVSKDGWFGMERRFGKAAWLLDAHDPVDRNAPLLAAARHKLLGFMPEAERHACRFYEEWSALDPADQAPHAKHAIMMLPRWFGSRQTIEIEARKAALRTATVTGDAAYFTMYQCVLTAWDPAVLLMDTKTLRRGAHDLISLRNGDPAFVAGLFQEMAWWTAIGADKCHNEDSRGRWSQLSGEIDAIRRDILLTRLTAICPRAWDGYQPAALHALSAYLQDEIKAGASFELGSGGLTVMPPEGAAAPNPA